MKKEKKITKSKIKKVEELAYIDTILLIEKTKEYFEKELEKKLGIIKVPSPLFVKTSSGLQDQLSGDEKPVSFVRGTETFEIVHSLAKWKREALGRYKFPVYTGLYTDMKAIRKDDIIDETHSLYVEQWDWEKVIKKEDRTISYLKKIVSLIYEAIKETAKYLKEIYPFLSLKLSDEVFFITAQELEDRFPDKTSEEREQLIGREKKIVFIIGIGDKLKSGKSHGGRSPDYDDWALNGDLLIFDKELDKVIELSSMGIRVDEKSLKEQLEKAKCLDRLELPYHQKIIKKELPYTIGGGIGVSRILLILLEKHHIAEVHASSWDDKTIKELEEKKIKIL